MSNPGYKFGDFEVDPSRFELHRNGQRVKIERIPLALLILLVEKKGDVVGREEIIERLWGKDVFLDTEHGINTAIRKIRAALRDNVDSPRFIQTISGKGYRFVPETLTGGNNGNSSAIAHLAASASPSSGVDTAPPPPPKRSRPRLIAAAALALALVFAAVLALKFGRLRNQAGANADNRVHSLAVLPLANLSGDASQDYFADGLTDELTTMLAKNTTLRIVSRTSAMQYKGVKRPLHEIARELGVDGIVEGSVSRTGDHVHLTAQLIYAPTDTHLWADSYERDLNQAFFLPAELSTAIAARLQASNSRSPQARNINPEAHDAYLRGRYFWFNGDDKRSQEYFEKAIQLQPDYAAAWAGLADSYILRAVDNKSPLKDVSTQTDAAVHRAVELDDSLAAAHHVMAAWYLFFTWDPARAEAESRRAIELDPTTAEQHHLHSFELLTLNRNDEALQEGKRAMELDPFVHAWGLGYTYLQLRLFDQAILELHLRADAQPNDAGLRFILCNAYWHKKMWKESELELEKGLQLIGQPEKAEAARKAFALGGERAVEQWGLDDALARSRKEYVSPFDIARQYAYLGDRANTLKCLEQCYREHYPWLIMLQAEPDFDFVHSEPRYQALIRKLGLQLQN